MKFLRNLKNYLFVYRITCHLFLIYFKETDLTLIISSLCPTWSGIKDRGNYKIEYYSILGSLKQYWNNISSNKSTTCKNRPLEWYSLIVWNQCIKVKCTCYHLELEVTLGTVKFKRYNRGQGSLGRLLEIPSVS